MSVSRRLRRAVVIGGLLVVSVENPGWTEDGARQPGSDAATAAASDVWQRLSGLFPHGPGCRWVYRLSGSWYAAPAELGMQVRHRQYVPRLGLEAVVIDETHPGVTPTAPRDVLPVLYYPRGDYLVRNTNHVYSDDECTMLMQTGTLGEAAAPVLPLDPAAPRPDWHTVRAGEWGEMSQLDTEYRFRSEPDPVVVPAGTYPGCLRAETRIRRVSGRGFLYAEWYAPGTGLVRMRTTDLTSGEVVEQKDLVEYLPAN